MTATLLAAPEPREPLIARSSVRVSRPPAFEPPFDDERDGPADVRRDTSKPTRSPWNIYTRQSAHGDSRIGTGGGVNGGVGARCAGGSTPVPPANREASAETGSARAAMRYVRLCIEVLNGFRPASHLRSVGGPVEFGDVLAQLRYRRNGHGHFRNRATDGIAHQLTGNVSARGIAARPGPAAPPRDTDHRPNTDQPRNHERNTAQFPRGPGRNAAPGNAPFGLTRLRVSEPLDGVAEVVAVLSQAGTSIAMALRLERRGADWMCTVVQVI